MPFDLAVIDLDNTLYAADNGVFSQMDQRINHFIQRELSVSSLKADSLRKSYWKQYGTTLKGLMLHHDVMPEDFLDEVHDINVHVLLQHDEQLHQALKVLPGRKVIHTNGTSEHAERVLQALGISEHFQAVYDIRYHAYQPKPCAITLQMLLDAEDVHASRSIVIDDMEENLAAAKNIGVQTAWVSTSEQKIPPIWDFQVFSIHDLSLQLIDSSDQKIQHCFS